MRKSFTAILTFLGGAYFIFEFILPAELPAALGGWPNPLSPHLGLATDLVIVLGTMAFLLGPINLIRSHAANLLRGRAGWSGSLVFLIFFFGSVLVAGGNELVHTGWARARLDAPTAELWGRSLTTGYNVLFYGIIFAFGTSSFALLTFYLVSAAYRSFRLNGLDSAVMFVAATIVLLGRAPIGDWLTQGLWEPLQLHSLEGWLMDTPNSAVQRAVAIGTFAGAFAASLRYWLGLGTRTE